MLVHVTGVPGTGKSTLRAQLEAVGFLAADGDDGLCAWFDRATSAQVADIPVGQRTVDWYENYQWRPIPGTIERLSAECADRTGFLLGVFGDEAAQGEHFGARFFLTAPTGVIEARLKQRDGHGYDTRFAAFGGLAAWQEAAESRWDRAGYAPLDAARPVTAVAGELLARVGLA
jgi:predicted kinase